MIMISPQNKRRLGALEGMLKIVFWLALSALIFFTESRAFIKSAILGSFIFLAPEKELLGESQRGLLLMLKIRDLAAENRNLKNALGIKNTDKVLPAKVIFKSEVLFADTILVDLGENAGVQVDDWVVAQDKIIVGNVVETGKNWSKAAAVGRIGDKIFLRQDILENPQSFPVEFVGAGAGELRAEVPAKTNLKAGSVFRLAEKPDYIVGLVENVALLAGEQFKGVTATSPISISALYEISIVSK